MRIAISLFVAGVVGATAAFHAAPTVAPAMTITHVADLPHGVVAALGFPLVDVGAPCQASNVVSPSGPLPFHRLIWARRDGAGWRVQYETGDRGHSYAVATLRPVAVGWSVTTVRESAPLA